MKTFISFQCVNSKWKKKCHNFLQRNLVLFKEMTLVSMHSRFFGQKAFLLQRLTSPNQNLICVSNTLANGFEVYLVENKVVSSYTESTFRISPNYLEYFILINTSSLLLYYDVIFLVVSFLFMLLFVCLTIFFTVDSFLLQFLFLIFFYHLCDLLKLDSKPIEFPRKILTGFTLDFGSNLPSLFILCDSFYISRDLFFLNCSSVLLSCIYWLSFAFVL